MSEVISADPLSLFSSNPSPSVCLSRLVTCERLIGPHDLRLIAALSLSVASLSLSSLSLVCCVSFETVVQGWDKKWAPGCQNFSGKEAEVASNSRNKIHQTRGHFLAHPCTLECTFSPIRLPRYKGDLHLDGLK